MYRKVTITLLTLLIAMVAPLSAASTPINPNSNKSPSIKTHQEIKINKIQMSDHEISNDDLTSNLDSFSEDNKETEEEKAEQLDPLNETRRDVTDNDSNNNIPKKQDDGIDYNQLSGSDISSEVIPLANNKNNSVAASVNPNGNNSEVDRNTDDDDKVLIDPTMGNSRGAIPNINNNKYKNQQNITQDRVVALIVCVLVGALIFVIIIDYIYPKTSPSPTEPATPIAPQAPDKASQQKNDTSVSPQKPTATPEKPTSTLQPVQDDDNTFKLVILFIWLLLAILLVGLWAFRRYGKD